MGDLPAADVQSFAFAELGTGSWGAGWIAGHGRGMGAIGRAQAVVVVSIGLATEPDSATWRISGDGLELLATPVSDLNPAEEEPESGEPQGPGALAPESLCRVTGHLRLGGEEQEIDSLGWRKTSPGLLDAEWRSIHQAAAWLSRELGLAVTSVRPEGARGHGEAEVTAAVLGAEPEAAEDPRLSTTYGREHEITRAGIEVWVARGDSDELFPLRAAGQALGPHAIWEQSGIGVKAYPLRWQSHDLEGGGIYLLAQRG